jgi:hypothetical protein
VREERALARRLGARGNASHEAPRAGTGQDVGATSSPWRVGGYATEPPFEDAVIFSCDSSGELKEHDDIVVGPVG